MGDEGSCAVVEVRGSLHGGNVEAFRADVTQALERGRTHLLIDMKDCESLDSTGLGALIWARANARRKGGDLALSAVRDRVRAQVSRAHLTKALPMHGAEGGLEQCQRTE